VIVSPYPHELNGAGTACAEDCPACRWVRENLEADTAKVADGVVASSGWLSHIRRLLWWRSGSGR
jgi:hypothetical protein